MNAAFRTEGKTTTQSALSSKSCGMLSGTSRISFKTEPQFRRRSSSLLSSEALAASVRIGAAASRILTTHCSLGASLEVASSNQEVVENREARGQEKGIGAGELKAINLMG